MLVVNIVLFVSAVCSAVNITNVTNSSDIPVASVTSNKLKRGTTDSDRNIRNSHEQFEVTQSTPRTPQDITSRSLPHYRNIKVPDTKRISFTNHNPTHRSDTYAYGSVPKRPFPYTSSPSESRPSSPLAPYFNLLNDPGAYKGAASAEKPRDASKSIVSLQRVQDTYSPRYDSFRQDKSFEMAGFPDFASEFPFSGIGKIVSQGNQNDASSPTVQVPVYKTNYPQSKVAEYAPVYAPSFPTAPSATPLFQSSEKIKQSPPKQNDEAIVHLNGKKISVPVIRLQNNPDLSGAFPLFEGQPFLLSANYPAKSDSGFNFEEVESKFNTALQSKNASPFSSPLSSFQGQVVPIQTSSSTPQFPQFKGASIEVYPVSSNMPKARGSYESIYNQPQLLFGKEHGGQPINLQQNTLHSSVSMDDILEDVEIINKKNPEPFVFDDVDENEDERYKKPQRDFIHSFEDDDDGHERGKYFKEPPMESDFKPSTSFPFKEYDERFGKHAAQINDEDSDNKSIHDDYSSSENIEEEGDEEEDSSAEYHPESSESPHGSYEEDGEEGEEEEEEEESRKHERREKNGEKGYHKPESKQSKYNRKNIEQKIGETNKKEFPKHRQARVKEAPKIEKSNGSKPLKRRLSNNRSSALSRERSTDSKSQESRTSYKNRKTKSNHRDSTAYGSNISTKRMPRVVYEEFFGYKSPESKKYSKHAKANTSIEKYSSAKKSPERDGHFRAAKYHKRKVSKSDSPPVSKNKFPRSYSFASNWKPSRKSFKESAPVSNVRQLSSSGDRSASYAQPSAVNGQMSSAFVNKEILRDLTGI